MNFARAQMGEQVVLVRRTVTRDADDGSEDHDSLSPEAFIAAEQNGQFVLTWAAHGLTYGLPITLQDDLEADRVVIANLSRSVLPALLLRYPAAVVVEVTAEPAIIARRLAERGREGTEDIRRRIERSARFKLPPGTVQIDNSGDLANAGNRFVALLRDLLRLPA